MEKDKIFFYKGSPITFQKGNGVMVNATEMAKPFGKRPVKWLELPSTKEFLAALTEVRKSDIALVQTDKGGVNGGGGTWMLEDVALVCSLALSRVRYLVQRPYQRVGGNTRERRERTITK